jgi:hypothetical protein
MKIILAAGYLTTTFLSSFCPLQMAAAMPMSHESMQHEEKHEEMDMTPMTPPMSPVALMSVAPVSHSSHTMPMLPSGNCTMGHCISMDHSGSESVLVSTSPIKLTGIAVLPFYPVVFSVPIDALPAPPPNTRNSPLAQTVSTIVLRV